MEEPSTPDTTDLLAMTGSIVVGYVRNNSVHLTELPQIIASVHASLVGLGRPKMEEKASALVPAVPIRKSITDEYLISLEDGRRYKTLKRHLSGLGMTIVDYRQKWDLPKDYPSVAPSYAAHRSTLARAAGLGRKPEPVAVTRAPEPAPPTVPEIASEPVVARATPKRGRPRKAKEEA